MPGKYNTEEESGSMFLVPDDELQSPGGKRRNMPGNKWCSLSFVSAVFKPIMSQLLLFLSQCIIIAKSSDLCSIKF